MPRSPSRFRDKIATIIEQSGSLSDAARTLGVDKSNLNRLRKGLHTPTPATVMAICSQMEDKKVARGLSEDYVHDIEVKLGLK